MLYEKTESVEKLERLKVRVYLRRNGKQKVHDASAHRYQQSFGVFEAALYEDIGAIIGDDIYTTELGIKSVWSL